jgi:hypothetical protein
MLAKMVAPHWTGVRELSCSTILWQDLLRKTLVPPLVPAWGALGKKILPKDGKPTVKDVGGKKYQWCVYHMAWGVHSTQECHLGASRKDAANNKHKDKPKNRAISYAAAAVTVANPSFTAFLSELSEDEE